MEKFKQSKHPDWLIFDDGASKVEFKLGTKYEKELAEYLLTNQIEPYETPEEEAARLVKENADALSAQKSTCRKILEDIEYRLNPNGPFPSDLGANKAYRNQIRNILASNVLQTIPPDPFKS